MRIATYKIILGVFSCLLVFITFDSQAFDIKNSENQCLEIGFKAKTEAYAECVLELVAREKNKSIEDTPDARLCVSYGFIVGSAHFAECRQKIDIARQQAIQIQNREADAKAAKQRELEKQSASRQLELGLRMMAGQGLAGAVNSLGTGAPVNQTNSSNLRQTIKMPNGILVHCDTTGSTTYCF